MSTINDRVRAAFTFNTDYLVKTLAQRQPGQGGVGSRFLQEMTLEEVASADWELYDHPAVNAPAVAFKAAIPGTFGLVRLDSLDPETPVVLRDGHDTSFVEACVAGSQGPRVEHTTLLLGPSGENEVVWTFFPGDPINPSRLKAEEYDGRELTAAEAIELGLEWAKLE